MLLKWKWGKNKQYILYVILIVMGILFIRYMYESKVQQKRKKQAAIQKQQQCRKTDPQETIFVSIPSYRDSECGKTIFSCLENASCPLRVFVGVLDYNDLYHINVNAKSAYDIQYKLHGSGNYKDQIRHIKMDYKECKGLLHARAQIERYLYKNERYYLCIDSHTRFVPNWDILAIQMWKSLHDPYAILTTFPPDIKNPRFPVYYARYDGIDPATDLPLFRGEAFKNNSKICIPSLLWSRRFAFGSAYQIQYAPYLDDGFEYLTCHDDLLMSWYLFSKGYNFYIPYKSIVSHKWDTSYRPLMTLNQNMQDIQKETINKILYIFGKQRIKKYDIPHFGTVRTLDQFQQYLGIQFITNQITKYCQEGLSQYYSEQEFYIKKNI